ETGDPSHGPRSHAPAWEQMVHEAPLRRAADRSSRSAKPELRRPEFPSWSLGTSWCGLILITLVLWLTVSPIQAGKFNRQLTPGDTAPGFTDLTGIDDQRHSLA